MTYHKLDYHFDILKDRMEPFLQFIPDMEYVFNPFDEPMVVAPHDVLSKAVSDCPISEGDRSHPWEIDAKSSKKVIFNNVAMQRFWQIATRYVHF